MLDVGILEGMVVDHHHFISILFGNREPFVIPEDLVGTKIAKRTVGIHFRYRP
ncbi:MAG: hypothetical protein H8K05_14305 [Nitrospira sp.]|nr:hypothetical protein [Nitrospira sp.]